MASRLHSAETLCKGMDRVGYANGDASMSDRKRQLQSMIEVPHRILCIYHMHVHIDRVKVS